MCSSDLRDTRGWQDRIWPQRSYQGGVRGIGKGHDWGHLLKYLPAKRDWFIDLPAGTLHAIGRDVLTYNVSRNADLTYRLFDYDRVDPKTGSSRELAIDKVIDCVNVPDTTEGFVWFEPYEQGDLEITDYWDEPGLYTVSRVKCTGRGTYELPRFAFYTVVEGAGLVNEIGRASCRERV